LKTVLAKLKAFQAKFGDDFKPAPLLEKLAAEGGTFTNS
jgi:3-hydroxyacyl-CoA dehydrogenase